MISRTVGCAPGAPAIAPRSAQPIAAIHGSQTNPSGRAAVRPNARVGDIPSRRAHRRPRMVLPHAASGTGDAKAPGERKAGVIGGGPAGLATAMMLAERGWDVEVWERLPEPPTPDADVWTNAERSYNLGINGRGQVRAMRIPFRHTPPSPHCRTAAPVQRPRPRAPRRAC